MNILQVGVFIGCLVAFTINVIGSIGYIDKDKALSRHYGIMAMLCLILANVVIK